jgi:hypothetical protein
MSGTIEPFNLPSWQYVLSSYSAKLNDKQSLESFVVKESASQSFKHFQTVLCEMMSTSNGIANLAFFGLELDLSTAGRVEVAMLIQDMINDWLLPQGYKYTISWRKPGPQHGGFQAVRLLFRLLIDNPSTSTSTMIAPLIYLE